MACKTASQLSISYKWISHYCAPPHAVAPIHQRLCSCKNSFNFFLHIEKPVLVPSAGQVVVSLLFSSGQEFPFKAPWHGTHAIATLTQFFPDGYNLHSACQRSTLGRQKTKQNIFCPLFTAYHKTKCFFYILLKPILCWTFHVTCNNCL